MRDFWSVLASFSESERASFLQFAWARSRLPEDSADRGKPLDQKSYRMQVPRARARDEEQHRSATSFTSLTHSPTHARTHSFALFVPRGLFPFRQLAIEEGSNQTVLDQRLPHSETCFFNISIPRYSSPVLMRAKLLQAMQTTSITH